MSRKEKIIPNELEYAFEFTDGECEKLRKGICPLEGLDRHSVLSLNSEDYSKCVRLIQSIITNGYLDNSKIILVKHVCGHHSFINGRHRLCAASKVKVEVLVKISDEDDKCPICSDESNECSIEPEVMILPFEKRCE